MNKLFLTTALVISLAGASSAFAQPVGPNRSAPQDTKFGVHQANAGASFRFTPAEIQQMQDKIREVQRALVERRYAIGKVDGRFGSRSAYAVKEFQRHHRIAPTGQLDARTLAALGVSSFGTPQAAAQDRHPATTGDSSGSRMMVHAHGVNGNAEE